MAKGFVHVYTGNGKGKTTAAIGLVVRAAGRGMRCFVGQFLKSIPYGEVAMLKERCSDLVTVELFGRPGHVSGPNPEDVQAAELGLARVREALASGGYRVVVMDEVNVAMFYGLLTWDALASGGYRVVVMDEVNVAMFYGLLTWDAVRSAVESRADGVEVVLTGRYAPQEAIEFADLVTEMGEVKHYYKTSGVTSRDGIER